MMGEGPANPGGGNGRVCMCSGSGGGAFGTGSLTSLSVPGTPGWGSGAWQTRWALIDEQTQQLVYFKAQNSTQCQGALDLTLALLHPPDAKMDPDALKTGFVVEHGVGGIQMVFNCYNEREREQWVHAMSQASGGIIDPSTLTWIFGDHVWAARPTNTTKKKAVMEATHDHAIGTEAAMQDAEKHTAAEAAMDAELEMTTRQIAELKRLQDRVERDMQSGNMEQAEKDMDIVEVMTRLEHLPVALRKAELRKLTAEADQDLAQGDYKAADRALALAEELQILEGMADGAM